MSERSSATASNVFRSVAIDDDPALLAAHVAINGDATWIAGTLPGFVRQEAPPLRYAPVGTTK